KLLSVKPAASGKLPLRFGRQFLPCPACVSFSIFIGNMHHGVVCQAFQRGCRPQRMTPVRSRHPGPPVEVIAQISRAVGFVKDHGAGHQILGRGAREVRRIEWTLGERLIASRLYETRELFVRDLVAIYPEAIHANFVNWTLFGIEVFGTHAECPAGYPRHTGMQWTVRCVVCSAKIICYWRFHL